MCEFGMIPGKMTNLRAINNKIRVSGPRFLHASDK